MMSSDIENPIPPHSEVPMMSEVKAEILQYIKSYYGERGSAPSVRQISERFKDQGVNRDNFYALFPKGLGQVCRAAGVPHPSGSERWRS